MMKQKLFRTAAAVLSTLMLPVMSGALPCAAAPALTVFGDYTNDRIVDVQDAAYLLQFLAAQGAGTVNAFEEYLASAGITLPETDDPTGLILGDANSDREVNASDAAVILQYAAAVGTGYSGTLGQFLDPPPANEDGVTQIGTAYLEASFHALDAQDLHLAGAPICTDGQYDFTWDISGCENLDAADSISLYIENFDPDPLGVYGQLALTVDEVWLDGVRVEHLTGEPQYASKTDHGYALTDITAITFPLRTGSYNDLDQEFSESIRIVFTISNLSVLTE